MDDFLNEAQRMPILEEIHDMRLCNVCAQEASYKVIKSDIKSEWD